MLSRVIRGHEFVSRVVEKGAKVAESLELGDLVVVEPLRGCGVCTFCNDGKFVLCESGCDIVGVFSDGGLCEEIVLPDTLLYKVPPSMKPEVAVLVEPVAVVVHAFRKIEHQLKLKLKNDRLKREEKVLIQGGGTLGILSILLAKLHGFERVFLSARYEFQKNIAKKLAETIGITLHVMETKEKVKADIVIETVGGSASTAKEAVESCQNGAILLLLGIFDDELVKSQNHFPSMLQIVVKELIILGSNCYDRSSPKADFDESIAILLEHGEALSSLLISHIVDFNDAAKAFEYAASKDHHGAMKVVVKM